MTRWVLFPIHHFPLSDFRAVVNAHVRIGRSGLLGRNISRPRKPSVQTGGTRLRSELESRLWAWTCPIGDLSLCFGAGEVWLVSEKEIGLRCLLQGRRMWLQALGIRRPRGRACGFVGGKRV